MNKTKTAFVTFFPIKPDTMGSSAVVNVDLIIGHIKKNFSNFS